MMPTLMLSRTLVKLAELLDLLPFLIHTSKPSAFIKIALACRLFRVKIDPTTYCWMMVDHRCFTEEAFLPPLPGLRPLQQQMGCKTSHGLVSLITYP